MKNVMKTIAALTFSICLLNQNAFAIDPVEAKTECKNNTCEKFRIGMYRVKNTETMNLLLEKEKGERLSIKIMDFKGKVLHEELVSRWVTKFGKKLNFAAMQDGTYTVEVSNDHEKVVKNIFLSTDEVREVSRLMMSAN
ncbi:T9SS type A sorting domain-containing protein [Dyadobacter aurulentus]|uniref:T9SS type A sorting domain-containing protein n=1 Tax=Dyadobacter sp. UC 10 TaxID=2605428 RepID=UPI0011F1EA0C|nr:T9SS type A sorting domain-containing protein [Dyadobacter sp. UC 10]KAA0991343.1 hypothetical protein FXO21_14825 [Dyadobacter sp. UC 10]